MATMHQGQERGVGHTLSNYYALRLSEWERETLERILRAAVNDLDNDLSEPEAIAAAAILKAVSE